MYDQLLQEHIKDKTAYGGKPQPPATADQLRQLRERARQELGVDLPPAYLDFLKRMNGLDSNGLVVYAGQTGPLAGYEGRPDMKIEGLVDANLGWWDLEAHKRYLFLGESGPYLFARDRESGKYAALDRSSNDVLEEMGSFEALLAYALERNRP
jgi:hypothetical protein